MRQRRHGWRRVGVATARGLEKSGFAAIRLGSSASIAEVRAGLTWWINYYNARRPPSMLAGRTPDDAYDTAEMRRIRREISAGLR